MSVLSARQVVDAVERDDMSTLAKGAPFAIDVPLALETALPQLGTRSRLVATWVLERCTGETKGHALLEMTADPDEQIAVLAARAMLKMPREELPAAERIAITIPVRLKPPVRRFLYLVLGRTDNTAALRQLRQCYEQERSTEALAKARVAAVRLGGASEREALIERLEKVTAASAEAAFEDLIYVGDPRLALATLAWFDDDRVVMNVGTHDGPIFVHMSDLATVAADRLGVPFEHRAPLAVAPQHPAYVSAARTAVAKIPRAEMQLGR